MKKYYVLPGVSISAAIIVALFFLPAKAENPDFAIKEVVSPFPQEVEQIFINACMGCHGQGGKQIAMSHLNFSTWSEYTPEKQTSKAESICNVVTEGSMPPNSFRKSHPDLVPTEAQIKSICDWSASLKK